jgi:hypothetical protein
VTFNVWGVLGALGLIVPPMIGIAPSLSLVAGIGLALIQVGEISRHFNRGKAKVIGVNIVLHAGVGIGLSVIWLEIAVGKATYHLSLRRCLIRPPPW